MTRCRCSCCGDNGHKFSTCPKVIGNAMASMSAQLRLYHRAKAAGLCPRCRDRWSGKTAICAACLEVDRIKGRERRARQRQARRAA